ncbi:MAG: hypothetical protein KatS3mg014_2724 [Actinomycetota bacterium]|nr:MAG: hypothetical protein KatS3mg014_2724 [Actinomycetota bacterium]
MGVPVLIEEDVHDRLARAAALAGWVLNRIDPLARVTHVAPAAALRSSTYLGWRTRDEHLAKPNTIEMSMSVPDPLVVKLQPPVRPRQILLHQVPDLVDDLIAMLRRAYRR